jgi:hypothetical protein
MAIATPTHTPPARRATIKNTYSRSDASHPIRSYSSRDGDVLAAARSEPALFRASWKKIIDVAKRPSGMLSWGKNSNVPD